jgi:hypothetical protein
VLLCVCIQPQEPTASREIELPFNGDLAFCEQRYLPVQGPEISRSQGSRATPATIAMRGGGPKTMKLGSVVKLLQKEHDRLTKQVKGIAAALEAFGATYGKQNGSRKISPAGRAKIAAAQRARWAKARAGNGANSRTKRKMSPAAKARIAAAQRARWAKVRTATRKSAA